MARHGEDIQLGVMGREQITLDDIVGQESAKEEAKKYVQLLENQRLVGMYGLKIPNMLFHGPHGTGKTLLAQAMAYEIFRDFQDQSNNYMTMFYSLNLTDIGTCYVNETANNFKRVMDDIMQKLYSEDSHIDHVVLFIDEFDSIAKQRGGQHNYNDGLVNTMNTYLDGENGIEDLSFIAATNFYEAIDTAMKSRFAIHAEFKPFKTEQDKSDLFKSHIKRAERKGDFDKAKMFKRIDYKKLAGLYPGEVTGREIRDIVNRTVEHKVYELIEGARGKQLVASNDDFRIDMKEFKYVIEQYIEERKDKSGRIGFK